MKIRIPTAKELALLNEMTGGRDDLMHWSQIYSWASTKTDHSPTNPSHGTIEGCIAPLFASCYNKAAKRNNIGFRPAADPSPNDPLLSGTQDGDKTIIGTLYMDGEPLKVPQNPTIYGDIPEYKAGAKLEMRKALDAPWYRVAGYRVGNSFIADRVLLTGISYTDITSAVKPDLETCEMLTLSTAHISEKTAEMLRMEPETNAMGLSVYAKTGGSNDYYGWFIYLVNVKNENVPSDLADCIKLAQDNHCGILCMDCDGPVVLGLETFDW